MVELKTLVEEHGETAENKIYETITGKVMDFHCWLEKKTHLSAELREAHLGNAHLFVELLAENYPYIFPEEIHDDITDDNDEADSAASTAASTAEAFKYFIYSLYIRRGPHDGLAVDCILDTLSLYFDFMLERKEIEEIPAVTHKITTDRRAFDHRLQSFLDLDRNYSDDEEAWIKAFDQWSADFYDY